MNPGCIVKFRPLGPWRIGPDSGARDRVDTIYHSDSLYSAVTGAMSSLGLLEEWLEATARNPAGAAVRFSSLLSVSGRHRLCGSAEERLAAGRFVQGALERREIRSAAAGGSVCSNGGALEEDRWIVDGQSECLIPHGRGGPFRIGVRSGAAVDRLGAGVEPHSTACLEFTHGRRTLDRHLVRRRAGEGALDGARCNPPSGCWPIPASAASARVAGAAAEPPEFVEGVAARSVIFARSPLRRSSRSRGRAAPEDESFWAEPPRRRPAPVAGLLAALAVRPQRRTTPSTGSAAPTRWSRAEGASKARPAPAISRSC